jgi:hypothetical protein
MLSKNYTYHLLLPTDKGLPYNVKVTHSYKFVIDPDFV